MEKPRASDQTTSPCRPYRGFVFHIEQYQWLTNILQLRRKSLIQTDPGGIN
jgi:hypothetical protein